MTNVQTNGHAPSVEELREANARERLLIESSVLRRQRRLTESFVHTPLPGELINPLERFFDGAKWTQPLYPFRRDERSPLWTEPQRDYLRAYARYLVDTNPYARAAVEGLCNYVIRQGFGYNLSPEEGTEAALVVQAQQALDDFLEEQSWP